MLAWQQRQQQSWGIEETYFTPLVNGQGVTTQQKEILREERACFSSRHARYTLRVLQSHDGAGGGRGGAKVTGVPRWKDAAAVSPRTNSVHLMKNATQADEK